VDAERIYAQDVNVFLRPLEFITGEGLAATFNCSVSNADGLLWRVDNINTPRQQINCAGNYRSDNNERKSQFPVANYYTSDF